MRVSIVLLCNEKNVYVFLSLHFQREKYMMQIVVGIHPGWIKIKIELTTRTLPESYILFTIRIPQS